MSNLSKSLLSLVVLTSLLILWGGVVRTTGSGLGCPDWPLCHGEWIPPFQKDVLIEYTHRLLASIVGLLTLGICLSVWLKKERRALLGKRCAVIFALLIVQISLGGITVKTELHPYVVATHMAVALIFLSIVFDMFLKTRLYDGTSVRQYVSNHRTIVLSYHRTTHLLMGLVFIQMVLGSLVAASNAGLACPDFPTCHGLWVPPLVGLVRLQFFHRLLGTVILLMSLRAGHQTFLLVLIQFMLGVAGVLLALPLWVRLAHLAMAVLLLLTLCTRTVSQKSAVSPR